MYGIVKNTLLKKVKSNFKHLYLLDPLILKSLAETGDPDARFLVGFAYAYGRLGFPLNINEAHKWLELSKSDWPHVAARCSVGFWSEGSGAMRTALLNYSYANSKNYIPGQYLYNKAMYVKLRSDELKNKVVDKALKNGLILQMTMFSNKGFVPATTFLGLRYFDGWGIEPDTDKALSLLNSAAEKGDGLARIILAEAYYYGIPSRVFINKEKAVKWYKLAAEQGFPEAHQVLKEIDKNIGRVLSWMPRTTFAFLETMVRFSNRFYEEDPPCKLTKLSDGKIVVCKDENVPVLTLSGYEKKVETVIYNEDILSEHVLFIAFLICGSPLKINLYSLDDADLYLKTTENLNIKFKKEVGPYKVELSQKTIEEFLKNEDLLDSYPIVKEAINKQLVEAHSN